MVERVEVKLSILTPIDSITDSKRLYAEPICVCFSFILFKYSSSVVRALRAPSGVVTSIFKSIFPIPTSTVIEEDLSE